MATTTSTLKVDGERLIEWWEEIEVLPEPEQRDLRAHLIEAHSVPAAVLDAHQQAEWVGWHRAEHKTRHPAKRDATHVGHLRHTHPAWLPKAAEGSKQVAA